jgi:predicted ArsR family transcriptional regulator
MKLSEKVVKEIVELRKKKMSIQEISKCLKISTFSVKKYSKNLAIKGKMNSGGRPRKTNSIVSKELVVQFSSNKFKNLSEGKIECMRQTVKNCLKQNGLKCFFKRKKPFFRPITSKKA